MDTANPRRALEAPGGRVGSAVLAAIAAGLVLAFYVWLASAGTWTKFPISTSNHGQLADAFLHGQLSFLQTPNPALLALPDPYDAAELAGVPYPLDYSLYAGKFYAYFGPVPALLLAPAEALTKTIIPDQFPGFAFICGLLLVNSLLIVKIQRRYFADLGIWAAPAGILVVGLALPVGLMLAASAHWSTVAVMGGAFFFMGGTLAAFDPLTSGTVSRWKLALAGILWAAAVGTRITLVVPVVLVAVLASGALLAFEREHGGLRSALGSILALVAPLLVGGAGLAWYNYARFGSPFETGLRYQLNPQSMAALISARSGGLFSPVYLLQNLGNYLLRPFSPHGIFPFTDMQLGWVNSVVPGVPLPASYHTELMTGLFWAAPIVVFSAWTFAPTLRARFLEPEGNRLAVGGLLLALWAACLGGGVLIMLFFWTGERYLADFVFPLYVLSVIGLWEASRHFAGSQRRRLVFAVAAIALIGITILVSNLVGMGQAKVQFDKLNPGAWERIQQLAGGDLRRFHPEWWQQVRTLFGPQAP